VIAIFQISNGFGTEDQRAVVRDAQHRITRAIEEVGVGELDGNEFGGGNAKLYAYGSDADQLFATMEPLCVRSRSGRLT
jgi:hypothetical protein